MVVCVSMQQQFCAGGIQLKTWLNKLKASCVLVFLHIQPFCTFFSHFCFNIIAIFTKFLSNFLIQLICIPVLPYFFI